MLDADHQALDVLTTDRLIEWVADGGGDAQQTVAGLLRGRPITIGADASVTDGVLAMVAANVGALALTTGGPSGEHVHGVVTSRDPAPIFGDQPSWILNDIGVATDHRQLRDRTCEREPLSSALSRERRPSTGSRASHMSSMPPSPDGSSASPGLEAWRAAGVSVTRPGVKSRSPRLRLTSWSSSARSATATIW